MTASSNQAAIEAVDLPRGDFAQSKLGRATSRYAPGLLLTAVIAMSAMFVSDHYGGPTMLYALLFGIAFSFLRSDGRFAPGVAISSKHILRIGVALLGVRVTFGDIASLGAPTVLLVISGVAVAILGGWAIGRAVGLKSDHAVLSAGAVAICGASAALAISAALPNHKSSERNTILTVVGVTALSTIAMVAYPMIARALGLNDIEAGVFLGATIHDVAQVVGAGYMISDSAGETATIVKLMRVACLAPVILFVGFWFRSRSCSEGAPTLAPAFLIGFVALVIVNSVGVVPSGVSDALTEVSRYALVCAVAALGVKTSLKDIVAVGPTPVLVLSLQTVLLAAFSLIGLAFFLSV